MRIGGHMLIVYTGNGKGKTTAAVGLAVRAAGAGKAVEVFKFMKGRESSEDRALESIGIKVHRLGRQAFVNLRDPSEADRKLALEGLEMMAKSNADVIIADELNVAAGYGLVTVKDALEAIRSLGNRVVVSTGRNAPEEFINEASIATEMREIKHHFNDGVPAIRGIDF